MVKKKEKDLIYAFIDSQNLNLGVKDCGWNLDFKKFRIFLKDQYGVSKAYLFIGHISGNDKLYSSLRRYGYTLIFKPTLEFKKNGNTMIKGNVDAELVLHTMIEYENFNKSVIVSGDGDFYCLIEYLENKKKLLKIVVPNERYSSLLRKYAKYIVRVNSFKKKVEKR